MDFDRRHRQALEDAVQAAAQCGGVVCRGSAALIHGWQLLVLPPRPQITIPKNKRTARLPLSDVELRKLNLSPDQVVDGVTTRGRTLVDCLRYYPPREGLCVADSALRAGFHPVDLAELAASARGPNARRVKLIARVADGRAANAFESATRAITLSVPGLKAVPQVPLYADALFLGRPDLVDETLRIVIEADSAEFHATVGGINRDSRRYDTFTVHGWLVLRFTWAQVVHDPDWVRSTISRAVAMRRSELGLPEVRTCWGGWGWRAA
ncbi:DUF559 domain-containing protein [Nocardioides montaniterrae]